MFLHKAGIHKDGEIQTKNDGDNSGKKTEEEIQTKTNCTDNIETVVLDKIGIFDKGSY